MKKPITLYTYALSPYGMKVYWALIYKRLPFTIQYVSPIDQEEIAFTTQHVVPVLQVGDEWRLESGPICCWLDELYPEIIFSGESESERRAIMEADKWISSNVIAHCFRSIIDDDKRFSAFRNGRILANTMRKTSGRVPWWAQFVWYRFLRRTPFIVNDASQVDRTITVAEGLAAILERVERSIESTGYLAGTSRPSYADISLFAQLVCNTTLDMEGAIKADDSHNLRNYYNGLCQHFDLAGMPELVPGWRPDGFALP